ncbi:hypothetical protein E4U57_007195 [Claviceps arundinis]|uniref:CENP-T/Histone H4 histone fold domain-containing protein n=1 Tax=Claviceps arundinis TaxID=1623583 RepID=A0A9P7MU76_9HYPO|nr:hypothetical protein E4U57_007195 [Claviceps arundinis]KAG5968516.1 hypothetical protein E4U56_000341 [Claviceps arundinis]
MNSSTDGFTSSPNKTPPRAPAALAQTPINRRVASGELPSSRGSAFRTPLDRASNRDLLNSVRRGVSASGGRRNNAPTPHAKAARRALDLRRTALLTPGKDRRQSLREQRETPMGLLRDLGRVLATNTRPVASSSPRDRPSSIAPVPEEDEGEGDDYDDYDDDDLPIQAPRLSLPLDDDDEDSDLVPPQSTGLEDDTETVPNIELPLRAVSERTGRFSGISFGSRRDSDNMDVDDDGDDIGRQSDFFPGLLEDLQARADAAANPTLTRIDIDDGTGTASRRESEFGLEIPSDVADQTTFMMSEPAAADDGGTSPLRDTSMIAAGASNAANVKGPRPTAAGDVTLDRRASDADVYDDSEAAELGLVEEEDEVETYGDAEEPEEAGAEAEDVDEGPDIGDESELAPPASVTKPRPQTKRKKPSRRISKYGIEYPPLPPSFVKRVAQTALHSSGLSNPRVSTDTLVALTQASEWFFEQLGDDLGAYANHAHRKVIDERDVATLMRRQRQITSDATMFSLAQRYLPRELLQELKMPVPMGGKIPRKGLRPDDDETGDSSEVTWTQGS